MNGQRKIESSIKECLNKSPGEDNGKQPEGLTLENGKHGRKPLPQMDRMKTDKKIACTERNISKFSCYIP